VKTWNSIANDALVAWLHLQNPEADSLRLQAYESLDIGHSAEMFALRLVADVHGREEIKDIVVRLRPREPGLLEPYDLQRQFNVLRALEPTEVRAPKALWIEPTGAILGRPFFVMERLPGEVFESRPIPREWDSEPGRLRRMCENMVDQFAAVHLVDLVDTGLESIGNGSTFLDRELEHWEGEMRRIQRGPLPAMERMLLELRRQQPSPCTTVTLVHGDPKPGNVAFIEEDVSAIFDWELVDVGDPRADVGYLEVMWQMPVGVTSRPSSLDVCGFVARYEERTGINLEHRSWYRAMQIFKLDVIQLIASMHFDDGHSDDLRALQMAGGIKLMTPIGLRDLGVTEPLEFGHIYPRRERIEQVRKVISASDISRSEGEQIQ